MKRILTELHIARILDFLEVSPAQGWALTDERTGTVDFDRILAIKKDAQARLRAIPGVHAVGIGAKVVGGKRTAEWSIIVYTVSKKAPSEIPPDEMIPAEIDGVKTDVIEQEVPKYQGLPDTDDSYRKNGLEGGIQIQTGDTAFVGTLGCIAQTDDPEPKIVAITCHHVVVPTFGRTPLIKLTGTVSADGHTVTLGGTVDVGVQVEVFLGVVATGPGTFSSATGAYVTTAADTLATIVTQLVTLINTPPNPGVTVTGSGSTITIAPAAGFTAKADVEINRLWGTVDTTHQTATIAGTVDPDLLVDASLSVIQPGGTIRIFDAFHVTTPGDSFATIATALAGEITNAAIAGFAATATGPSLTLNLTSGTAAAFNSLRMFQAHGEQKGADLKAAVTPTTISFTGRVSGDYYGVYTSVNIGGFTPTYGTFINPVKGMDPTDLAASIVSSLNALAVPGVTFSNAGQVITAMGPTEEIECLITADVRVGQASNDFSSTCCDCCNDRIGKVVAARQDIDCALVQLDPGRKYMNDVVEIGNVTGAYEVTNSDVDPQAHPPKTYSVQKRGRTTGKTFGQITALHVDGDIDSDLGLFGRHYINAFQIAAIAPTLPQPFSGGGDSGAAVLNMTGDVVGILFGGGASGTFATPITDVNNTLEVIVQTATAPGKVLVVPKPATAHALMATAPATGPATSFIRDSIRARLNETVGEIATTPKGKQYAALIRHHTPETRWLIDTNRRVAAVWQRCGGPQLVQALMQMLQRHDQALPAEIDGRPLAECVAKIQKVLTRYASPGLAAGLREYAPRIAAMGGLNYAQILDTLREPQTE